MKPSHDGKATGKMSALKAPGADGKATKKRGSKTNLSASYNEFKQFEGQRYTGMKIGRSHKWYYDKGEWKEKKVTPDLWQINYAVTKRRAGHAPEGSGVPVGTEYHWYIIAQQNVKKLNANDYSTSLTGMKFKVAHKRADSEKWSASERAQRRRMIKFLQETIRELQQQDATPPKETTEKHEGKATRRKQRQPALAAG
jgi:hypothetical protein